MNKFSIFDGLSAASVADADNTDRARLALTDVPYDKIYRNSDNFYPQSEIKELAAKILMVGLLEPMTVTFNPCEQGEYRLTDGERRYNAIGYLREQGYEGFDVVSVRIKPVKNEHEERITLILGNSYRTKDIATLIKEEQVLKEELTRMKAEGMSLNGYDLQKGRIRDVIADLMNVSKTKVAELEAIAKHLRPELMKKLENGEIKQSTAYQLSKLTPEEQANYVDKPKVEKTEPQAQSDVPNATKQKECANRKQPGESKKKQIYIPSLSQYILRTEGCSVADFLRRYLPDDVDVTVLADALLLLAHNYQRDIVQQRMVDCTGEYKNADS